MATSPLARPIRLLIALCALNVAGLSAQAPGRASNQPVFKAGVELVRLDVRVTDDEGRPIKNLHREDFEVLEDGQSRPIVFFEHLEEPSGTIAEVARRTVASEVSTNQGAARGHLYVLVFDQNHIATGNEQRARIAAEKFLKSRIRPGDRVAAFALPGPGPQVDFTPDVAKVSKELVKVRGALERIGFGALGAMRVHEAYEIVRGNDEILTRVATGLSQASASTDFVGGVVQRTTDDPNVFTRLVQEDARTIVARADEEARRFLLMLADLMHALRNIEGRKSILLFSEGFYTDHLNTDLERAAAAAAQSYSVIYSFDLNAREIDPHQMTPVGHEPYAEIHSRLAPLGTLAAETDGALVNHASSWLDRALSNIADQSQDYYVLGFEPHPDAIKTRGSYRRVKVNVAQSGARVGTRTGYSITSDSTPVDRRRAINGALGSPFPQQSLRVEYTTYVLHGTAPGAQKVLMSLEAELPLAVAGKKDTADVVFAVRDRRDGRVVASGTDVIQLPDASRPGATTGVGTYRVQFDLAAGEYLMRAVVREPGGLVGSADRGFVVQALDRPGVTVSDLILGSIQPSGPPVRASAYASDVLTGALELYGRTPEQVRDVVVKVDLAPLGGSAAVRSTDAELLQVKPKGSSTSREARIELPLEGVPPGQYLARAVVRAGGETVAELVREVAVLQGIRPAAARNAPAVLRPLDVLSGQVAQRYIVLLRDRTRGARLEAAGVFAASGDWRRVEAALGPAENDTPGDAQALRGLALFARGDYGPAAHKLKAAFETDPKLAAAAFVLGWCYAGSGDDRRAIGAWRNAAMFDPSLVPAHLALADAYVRLSQPSLAAQAVRAGLTALPNSPELLGRLSELQRR